jgi:hypothetical protein
MIMKMKMEMETDMDTEEGMDIDINDVYVPSISVTKSISASFSCLISC